MSAMKFDDENLIQSKNFSDQIAEINKESNLIFEIEKILIRLWKSEFRVSIKFLSSLSRIKNLENIRIFRDL